MNCCCVPVNKVSLITSSMLLVHWVRRVSQYCLSLVEGGFMYSAAVVGGWSVGSRRTTLLLSLLGALIKTVRRWRWSSADLISAPDGGGGVLRRVAINSTWLTAVPPRSVSVVSRSVTSTVHRGWRLTGTKLSSHRFQRKMHPSTVNNIRQGRRKRIHRGRVGIAGGLGLNPPVHVYTDAHFWLKIGFKFQSLGKISNISTYDPPVLLGQFQHCTGECTSKL